MRKLTASEKAIVYYELSDGWYMLHIKTKVNGTLSRVDTYVGTEEDGYSHVGYTEGLDNPGVIGGFREYNQSMQLYAKGLVEMARSNMRFPAWDAKHGIYEVIR